jgi:hypothetical protein
VSSTDKQQVRVKVRALTERAEGSCFPFQPAHRAIGGTSSSFAEKWGNYCSVAKMILHDWAEKDVIFLVFPAEAGTHRSHRHRPSPV